MYSIHRLTSVWYKTKPWSTFYTYKEIRFKANVQITHTDG